MSKLITPYLDRYREMMQFEFGCALLHILAATSAHIACLLRRSDDQYLFFCAGDFGRNQSESQFCQTVKRLFKKFSPGQNETPPRLLRQSFITVCAQQDCLPMVPCH